MSRFIAEILKFNEQGEKTGWTYIKVPREIAAQLKPGNRKSFKVRGRLDDYIYEGISLLPMGEGHFIMPLNAAIRKAIRKQKGAKLTVSMEVDHKTFQPPEGFMESLEDEPAAVAFFNSLNPSHRNYFMKWVASAKTEQTKIKRIAQSVTALAKGQDFGAMIRSNRKND